jgi:Tfp pilus assembly protein PilX
VNFIRARMQQDERGAALILAIAFMLVIGAVGGAVLSSVTSGLNDRVALDNARNREYAADGLIDYAIAKARAPVTSWNAGTPPSVTAFLSSASSIGCGGPYRSGVAGAPALNDVNNNLRVDCTPAPGQTRAGALTRNAIFTACPDTGAVCTDAAAIVRAQINFSDSGSTIVQAWSVNG